jgi:PLP dependent protein
MPISEHVTAVLQGAVQEAVVEVRSRIADARTRGGHGQEVTLVAVTKTHGPEAVYAAYAAGVTDVGENRVQEAEPKMASVSVPVRWHLIGHLQRNKAKHALRFSCVHGLDSERLAVALHDEAAKTGQQLDVLVQVNVSGEASKSGVAPADVPAFAERLHALTGLRVRGVMTMAPFDAEERILRDVFAGARAVRTVLQAAGHNAEWLSMGMSGDYEIAVEEGATHVRLGTVLFGSRT